ncbi:MAG: sulfurtransferase TusA family protein [Magnetococcus sp. XQGC-1]
MTQELTADLRLDLRHLLCPLPILRAEAAMANMRSGEILELRATDPGIVHDLPAWCSVNGHRLLELKAEGREWIGRVAKG